MVVLFGALVFARTAQAQYVASDYGGIVWRKTYTLANNETLLLQTVGCSGSLTVNLPCSSTTWNCWIVAGLFYDFAHIKKFEVWGRVGADADGDGIEDGIETVKGTRTDLKDTDGDGLTDGEELVGVAASSLDGIESAVIMPWEDTGADPTSPDLFIEIDYMAAADHSHNPSLSTNWPNQQSDMEWIFANDLSFTNRSIRPHVQISDSLPETTYLTFGSCSGADTTNFYTIKNDRNYFDPLRAGIFHYAIWGHRRKDNECTADTAIGQGEIWGNDVIITLGGSANQVGSTTLQRVNYIHELGHNLSLSHNGNGNSGNANSCVHASVMNYRYSHNGWSNTLRGSSFSQGTCTPVAGCANTCAANHCVPSDQTTTKSGCSSNNGSCDCDRSEWSIVNLDIPASAQMSYSGCQVSTCGNGNLPDDDVRALFLAGAKKGPLHQRLLKERKALAEQRGLRENVDFKVHPDNGRMYSIE